MHAVNWIQIVFNTTVHVYILVPILIKSLMYTNIS